MRVLIFIFFMITTLLSVELHGNSFLVNQKKEYIVNSSAIKFKKSNIQLIPQKLIIQLENDIIKKCYQLNFIFPEYEKCSLEYISKIDLLIQEAKSYLGTPYLYGGNTREGIDCSAFVRSSYSILDIDLERISSEQALQGECVDLEEAKKGDLLFFSQSGNQISHVAMIENVNNDGKIFFIHASCSRGVVIASLNDLYWSKRHRKTVRMIVN